MMFIEGPALYDLDCATNKCIIKSLFRREIGVHDHSVDRICCVIQRQLIRGRAGSPFCAANDYLLKDKHDGLRDSEDWNYATLLFAKAKTKELLIRPNNLLRTSVLISNAIILDDCIFVRRDGMNQRYYCFAVNDIKRQSKYSIPSKKCWSNWETYYPTESNPPEIIYKEKIRPTLFILEKDNPHLYLYDFNNGQLIQRVLLDNKVKFNNIWCCSYDLSLSGFVLQSSTASLPKTIAIDFILMNYPPLVVATRCQISKSAFEKSIGIEIAGQFIYVNYSNSIEICDLRTIFDKEFKLQDLCDVKNTSEEGAVKVTHFVNTKLPVLKKLNSCFQSYLEINSWGIPPYYITRGKTGLFKMFNTRGSEIRNPQLLALSDSTTIDPTLTFHPDGSGRVILCGGNEIRVMKFTNYPDFQYSKLEDEKIGLEVEFSKIFQVSAPSSREDSSNSITPTRKSSRTIYKPGFCDLSFDQPEVGVRWEYHNGLDIFALMEISKHVLKFHLYDNKNWSSIIVFESNKFQVSPIDDKVFTVPVVSFDFSDYYLTTKICKAGSRKVEKIYFASLL